MFGLVSGPQIMQLYTKLLKKINSIENTIGQCNDITELAEKSTKMLVEQFGFNNAALLEKNGENIVYSGSNIAKDNKLIRAVINKYRDGKKLKIGSTNNYIAKSATNKAIYFSDNLEDVFVPAIPKYIARKIQKITKSKKFATAACTSLEQVEAVVIISTQEQDFSELEKILIDFISKQIGNTIDKIRSKQKSIDSALHIISDMIEAINGNEDELETMQQVIEMLRAGMHYDSMIVLNPKDNTYRFSLDAKSKLKKYTAQVVEKYAKNQSNSYFLKNKYVIKASKSLKPVYPPDFVSTYSPPFPKKVIEKAQKSSKVRYHVIIPCSSSKGLELVMIIGSRFEFTKTEKLIFEILSREIGYALQNHRLLKSQKSRKEELRRILDSSLDGVIIYRNGEIDYVSPKMSQTTEYSIKEIKASKDAMFLLVEQERKRVEIIAEERDKHRLDTYRYNTKILTKTGSIVPVEINTSRFRQDLDDLLIVNFRDMSSQLETSQNLKKIYENQGKLFSQIAHSLKTPFTVIYGLLELSQGQTSTKREWSEACHAIKTEVDYANKKVSELLDIAKLNLNEYPIHLEIVESKEFIEAAYIKSKSMGYNYCHFGHSTDCNCLILEENENAKIKIDKQAVMDVLMTLIENSYTHSVPKSQKPRITISSKKRRDFLEIIIKDKGLGITDSQLKKLFQPFSHKKIGVKGHGIGLPMCKKIINEHDGSITARSKLKVGTQFSIKLPLV